MALRYLVAGTILFPAFCKLKTRSLGDLGWPRGIVLTLLSGAPYMAVFFSALGLAPAAHGAVLNPGLAPAVVFFAMVFLKLRSFSLLRVSFLALIFVGLILVTATSFSLGGGCALGRSALFYLRCELGTLHSLAQAMAGQTHAGCYHRLGPPPSPLSPHTF